jgi:hypothetical protein
VNEQSGLDVGSGLRGRLSVLPAMRWPCCVSAKV